jgi:hypothetical protein
MKSLELTAEARIAKAADVHVGIKEVHAAHADLRLPEK